MSKFEYIAGGGKTIKVDQGGEIGVITVSGTPMIRHDLPEQDTWRKGELNDPLLVGAALEQRIADELVAWCAYHGHEGEDRELPISQFDEDSTRPNGHHPYCKTCRSLIRRAGYEKQEESKGRTPRPYRRRERHTKAS